MLNQPINNQPDVQKGETIYLQKGGNFRPINSTNQTYFVRNLNNIINACPSNLIINLFGTKYVVNKDDKFKFVEQNVLPIPPNQDFNNVNLKFVLPKNIPYCITDITMDQTCMAKTTCLEDEYYCDTINTKVMILRGTTIYDLYGNKFIVDADIKDVRL
jgi:hypothetical protein